LFSIAPREGNVVAVGGDYKQEAGPALVFGATAWGNAFVTGMVPHNGEVILERGEYFAGSPSGFRSGIACTSSRAPDCVATGPAGTDFLVHTRSGYEAKGLRERPSGPVDRLSIDDFGVASEWRRLSDAGYDSVSIAGGVAWFSGDGGRLARMQLPPTR
jgi:hypothetical protein